MKFTIVILVLFFACEVATQSGQAVVPNGVWGGRGIEVTVKADRARIDYGCDSGTIDGPLRTDSRGKFSASGTHAFGSGGPSGPGDPAPKPRQAKYEGVRKGDKMELSVFLPELNRKVGPFNVERGRRPVLERCG
jgi:hypothetical protein